MQRLGGVLGEEQHPARIVDGDDGTPPGDALSGELGLVPDLLLGWDIERNGHLMLSTASSAIGATTESSSSLTPSALMSRTVG